MQKIERKINSCLSWLYRNINKKYEFKNGVGYLTIYHDYEGEYARPGLKELSRYSVTKILDIQKKYNICATYNVVGKLFDDEPDIIRRLIDEGHDIASHSYGHQVMTGLSRSELYKDIQNSIELFKKWDLKLEGFRSPQSRWNFSLMKALAKNGFKWSAEDESLKTPYVVYKTRREKIFRFPIVMDDWDYMRKNITPDQMYSQLIDKTKLIINNQSYGAIGFHPWVQGEKEGRLKVFEDFMKYISENDQIRILTFSQAYTELYSN